MREPKKRERLRFSLATLLPIHLREPTKLDQSRLLRMEFQRSLVCALPSAGSAEVLPSLFVSFIGTMAQSDSSKTYMSG